MVENPSSVDLRLDVGHQRAHEALEVDAVVGEEALVLDGDHGESHDVGDLLAADDRAVLLAVQVGEQGAVAGVDLARLGEGHVALGFE